jgi:hypothetical protein
MPARSLDKDAATEKALGLLEECLNDEHPRTGDELVERMEEVYRALGGEL